MSTVQEEHKLHQCTQFKSLAPQERRDQVKKLRCCFNCLSSAHMLADCPSLRKCRECQGRHNTLIHIPTQATGPPQGSSFNAHVGSNPLVLLPTAKIPIENEVENFQKFRAFLDSGSQSSFITKATANQLGLQRTKVEVEVTGLGAGPTICKGSVLLKLSPNLSVNALVLDSISDCVPCYPKASTATKTIQMLRMAVDVMQTNRKIDVLLGSDIYEDLFYNERFKKNGLYFRKSIWGWVISGTVEQNGSLSRRVTCSIAATESIHRFWEVEEKPEKISQSEEHEKCQNHFHETTTIVNDRFSVSIPFKSDLRPENNFAQAKQRFLYLEKRLQANPELYEKYRLFIKEFLDMEHLEIVPRNELNSENVYYLPHHCVFKEDSTTTKLRVVFDGSNKTKNQLSLNDCILIGPKNQDDLFHILCRFRIRQVVFTADFEKMYRQIAMNEPDRDYLRILWRESPEKPILTYRMRRVTYEVKSSPFHAIQSVKMCCDAVTSNSAKRSIDQDFYVDDLLTGADNKEAARALQIEVTEKSNRKTIDNFHCESSVVTI